jgi:hypothetical protein
MWLISDCYHYRAPGMNFHRGFHAYRWIRGQEYDPWTSHPNRTWSLIQCPPGEQDELYNLVEDPRERTNVIEQYPEEARRLSRAFGIYYRLQIQKGDSEIESPGIQGKYELASSGIA